MHGATMKIFLVCLKTLYRNMDHIVPNECVRVTSKFRITAKNGSKHLFGETGASHNLTSISRFCDEYQKRSVKNKFLHFKKTIFVCKFGSSLSQPFAHFWFQCTCVSL